MNRNHGAGTRVWIDRLLAAAGIDPVTVPGYEHEVTTHEQAARAVACGAADIALGIYAAARAQGLDFVPLMEERYDLVMPRPVFESELVAPLLGCSTTKFKRDVDRSRGLRDAETGAVAALAVSARVATRPRASRSLTWQPREPPAAGRRI